MLILARSWLDLFRYCLAYLKINHKGLINAYPAFCQNCIEFLKQIWKQILFIVQKRFLLFQIPSNFPIEFSTNFSSKIAEFESSNLLLFLGNWDNHTEMWIWQIESISSWFFKFNSYDFYQISTTNNLISAKTFEFVLGGQEDYFLVPKNPNHWMFWWLTI